jgi:FkbM family methyltransferase
MQSHENQNLNHLQKRRRRGLELAIYSGMDRELDLLLHEIFEKKPYTRHGIVLKDGDCVVDLGANMGLFSLWCTHQAKHLQIYACEPIRPLYELARINLEDSKGCNIRVEQLGVGLRSELRELTYFPKATACSTMHPEETVQWMPELYSGVKLSLSELWSIHKLAFAVALLSGPFLSLIRPIVVRSVLKRALAHEVRYNCEILNLSEMIERWGLETIDLLKIDVQGAEVDALMGIKEADWHRIRAIALEVNTFLGRSAHADVAEMLRQRGYRVVREEDPDITAPGSYFVYATREAASCGSSP